MPPLILNSVHHKSSLGVVCQYVKSIRGHSIDLEAGLPSFIWPLAPGRISSLEKQLLKSPIFIISNRPLSLKFESSFAETLVIEFGDPAMKDAVEDTQPVQPGFKWPREHMQMMKCSDWLKALLKRYFFERIVCASSQLHCTYFLEKQLLNEIINIAFRTSESRKYLVPEKNEEKHINVKVAKMVEFLRRNANRSLSIKELEAFTGFSGSECSRIFKQEMGVTPISFHRKSRLEEAKRLIDEGKLTVNQATIAFGYSDGTAFRHAFKNEFGVPPKNGASQN